ncbi:superoxide dismutase [Candidatus Gottesmanbacteria bacterium]|nr:superoxide dismutase [Candidatus Gottesmanbacteria bacterium]
MFTLPDLPYAYNALEPFIDERTMQIHHDKHHAGYVKNLNDVLVGNDALLAMPVEELMKNLSQVPETVRTKVRNNGGGHANHSMFWTFMGPSAGNESRAPQGELAMAIDAAFGSYAKFQEQFATAGISRFGSGWVWLVANGKGLSIIDTPNQDTPIMDGKAPILGLDVWEHAYYLKYQNMRADYIKAWWNVVNWPEVEKRFASAV